MLRMHIWLKVWRRGVAARRRGRSQASGAASAADTAAYIADMLPGLQTIAAKADMQPLADMLLLAHREALRQARASDDGSGHPRA